MKTAETLHVSAVYYFNSWLSYRVIIYKLGTYESTRTRRDSVNVNHVDHISRPARATSLHPPGDSTYRDGGIIEQHAVQQCALRITVDHRVVEDDDAVIFDGFHDAQATALHDALARDVAPDLGVGTLPQVVVDALTRSLQVDEANSHRAVALMDKRADRIGSPLEPASENLGGTTHAVTLLWLGDGSSLTRPQEVVVAIYHLYAP